MNITWHGFSCFRIQESDRQREVSIVTDPYAPEDKKKLPRSLAADVLLISHDHPRHNNKAAVGGDPFLVDTPGEFEIKEVTVTGVSTFHDQVDGKEKGTNNLYYINTSGVHLLFLGDLKHKLEEKHFTDMHEIDVLFLPVGGHDVLSPKQAVELVGQLEPRIIIPMHYKVDGLAPKYEPVSAFFKEMGLEPVAPVPKLKLTKKDLPQDEMKVVVLDPQ
jgi:L-ascorbate metabolism protein UlaG (beta-lactamase superfamily)